MPRTLGAHSPILKQARALATVKGRREQRRFLLEGPTLVTEALASELRIPAIFATQTAYDAMPLLHEAERDGSAVWILPEAALRRLSDVVTPTGIVAIAEQRIADAATVVSRPGAVLALAGIGDPGNAGTMLRSAEAFGAAGVLFGEGGVEPYHPKVVRSAMGALFRVAVARVSEATLKRAAGDAGRPILGLSPQAAGDVSGLSSQAVIVVGQERTGLGSWAAVCSGLCKIPMQAGESLNAAVAASIALYEASKRDLSRLPGP
jgi:TrmH family RNA methyltransferase